MEQIIRKYQNKEWLKEQFVTNKRSAKDIAKECNVSYKLVNLWLVSHYIVERTPEMKLP